MSPGSGLSIADIAHVCLVAGLWLFTNYDSNNLQGWCLSLSGNLSSCF